MRNIILTVCLLALGLVSCKKKETKITPKDYSGHTVYLNMNHKDGKLTTNQHTGEESKQYFYSMQYFYNITDYKVENGVVNSSSDYQEIVLPQDPNTTLKEKLPTKDDWQIAFTQYASELEYEGSYIQYNLVGALINVKKGIEVAHVKKTDENSSEYIDFEKINLKQAEELKYSNKIDAIGADWKAYMFTTNSYSVIENNYFIIKIKDDEVYKLRFIDFNGPSIEDEKKIEKGHVQYQIQLLK